MGRAEDIIKAYEAWDPDQESATDLASRLGISKARLYQVLEREGITPKARRPRTQALQSSAPQGPIFAAAMSGPPSDWPAGVSLIEERDARQELQRLLDELDVLRREVAEYRKRYGPLD